MYRLAWILTTAVVAATVILWLKRIVQTTETENRNVLDNWVDSNLAQTLAKRLQKPTEMILRVLHGTPEPGLIAAIDAQINSVNLSFNRSLPNRNVEVRLTVAFEDGTSFSAVTQRNWDQLPDSIREEFLRGGEKSTHRPWHFPWTMQQPNNHL